MVGVDVEILDVGLHQGFLALPSPGKGMEFLAVILPVALVVLVPADSFGVLGDHVYLLFGHLSQHALPLQGRVHQARFHSCLTQLCWIIFLLSRTVLGLQDLLFEDPRPHYIIFFSHNLGYLGERLGCPQRCEDIALTVLVVFKGYFGFGQEHPMGFFCRRILHLIVIIYFY